MKKITIIIMEQEIEYKNENLIPIIHEPKTIKTKTINLLPNEKANVKLTFKN